MTTELNKIEGFDPAQYARTITDANGQESQYLDVQYRKMWFRLCNPNGKIVKKICSFDSNLAVVEARVYLDRNAPPESFVGNAFAQRFADPNNPEYGMRYLESAETAAVGRALADAGYGLQFCIEPDPPASCRSQSGFGKILSGGMKIVSETNMGAEALRPVDMGQQMPVQPNMMPEASEQPIFPALQQNNMQQYGTPVPTVNDPLMMNSAPDMMYNPSGCRIPNNYQNGSMQNTHMTYGNIPQQSQPAKVFTHQMPVEQIVAEMPYSEAVKVVYRCNGKHNGKTLGQIAAEDFDSIRWIAESYKGDKNLFKGAARIIYNKHTGQ